ncbi:MAG: NAD-dependent epimerase/dehydratase family protein [Actinomycetota bacterium]|nr:NAD-dependent epimerase/dehydratase family protein [Actinomycetota bacterium]
MALRLLVLGGSQFAGRAVVEEGLSRGWKVVTFNRGLSGSVDSRAEHVSGDRLDPETLTPLLEREWDLVLDTWSGAPIAVRDSARALADRAARYAYISSESVYAPPPPLGATEDSPTVDASPDLRDAEYAECKRGAEMAVLEAFGDRTLLARAGLILGPQENIGRLPWWLTRIAAGGEVLAPGPPDLGLQYIDVRDLARFALDASLAGHSGAFNVASRRGHASTESLLEACRAVTVGDGALLTWVDPEFLVDMGIEPWTELPIWLPPDHQYAGLHAANVERAYAAGLSCRPVRETVADTWTWMSGLDGPPPQREDRAAPGLEPTRERDALAAWHAQSRPAERAV